MRNSFLSVLLSMILFIAFQYALQFFLAWIGIRGIALYIIFDLILAFVFSWFQYPSIYRKQAFKDPNFHKSLAIYFIVFIVFDLLFLFL